MGVRILLVSVLTLLTQSFYAQQVYSLNQEKFVKEFQKSLGDYGMSGEAFVKKDFPELLLESGKFPGDYFSTMVNTCNLIMKKRLKIYPEMYNYVYSVSKIVEAGQSKESFEAWQKSIEILLSSRNPKKFKEFSELSAGFFEESRISESSNHKWYYYDGEYEFFVEKDKPFIRFTNGVLSCRIPSKKQADKGKILDSIQVIGTSGVYDPVLKKWQGTGGKITWERVGLDPTKTFAMLQGYEASMKTSRFSVDTVSLTTPYFDKEIKGMLGERAFVINREMDKIYPQFASFEQQLLIEELIENVDYVGGFGLKGGSFIGMGTDGIPASVTYKKDGLPFVQARGTLISLDNKKLSTYKAQFAMYLNTGDSLTHPGVDFTYNRETKAMHMVRGKGIGESPFHDSYHMLEIYVPKITWVENTESLLFTYDFGASRQLRMASFESSDYFNEKVYDQLQTMSGDHPLSAIWTYCFKFDQFEISEGKACTALGLTVDQGKGMLLKLANMGFITYDTEKKMVGVNKKLENFVKSKGKKVDYDNILFKSDLRPKVLEGYTDQEIEDNPQLQAMKELYEQKNEERRLQKNFGVMSLATLDLNIEAVDQVLISHERNTLVYPDRGKVNVKKNRSFSFTGWINAGKLELNARACNFNYDDFKFEILSSDKALLRVVPLKKEDGLKSIPMTSTLSGIIGEILVDGPTNRSGNFEGFENYPRLISDNSTKIYYYNKRIFRGAYDSTRFYYTVFPFELDSLNTFDEKSLRIGGELISAGIFPTMKDSVKIMPDYSFGFSTEAPKGGYEFYGTEAKFHNKIMLSHNGLQGAGEIEFVKSTSTSITLFSFLPDSTVGMAKFRNEPVQAGTEFPEVDGKEVYISYVPKGNMLKAKTPPKVFMDFFGGEVKMKGTAIVEPTGMRGNGVMSFERATILSHNFNYTYDDITADTSSFSLKNDNTDLTENAFLFKTTNVTTDISLKDRKGVFKSNDGESTVEFPVNRYACKMDQFVWLMDDEAVEMQTKEEAEAAAKSGVSMVGPNFYSTDPKLDSLQFRAPKAKFDLVTKNIECNEVEYINIADARIYPDSMKVTIRKKGKMDKFVNAKIVANYITEYHQFIEADVEVRARRDYSASGKYPYYDVDSNVTYIEMNDIGLDTTYQTRASGIVKDDENFKLSAEFDFYGKAFIKAATKGILFEGATRINHGCNQFDRNWMAFEAEIDPANIQIPVSEEMKDLDGNRVSAGVVWRMSTSPDSLRLYPTFLSALEDKKDPVVLTSNGFLQFDKITKEFQIGTKEKLLDRGEKGNYIALNTETCSMNGDGKIELGLDYGDLEVSSVGVVNYNQESGLTDLNLTMGFTMPIDKGLMEKVAERIAQTPEIKPVGSNWSTSTLEQAILEWQGSKEADKFKTEYIKDGMVKKMPKAMEDFALVLTDVHLQSFDNLRKSQRKGLITNMEGASIVSMYGKPVMRQVPMKGFFEQTYASADLFMLYFMNGANRDYFFNYKMVKKDGVFSIITTDEEMQADIEAIKEDKRKKRNFKYEFSSNKAFILQLSKLF